jgi:hypothetical protein
VLGQRGRDDLAAPLRESGMARVRLDHHRAAGGERAGGVPTGDREREREVAGGEDRDRPERDQHAPQVGPRRRQRVRVGQVDDRVDERALVDQVGERLKLDPAAGQLTTEAGHAQAGLGVGQRHQLIPGHLQRGGDRPQQPRPFRQRRRGAHPGGLPGRARQLIQPVRRRVRDRRSDGFPGVRVHALVHAHPGIVVA